MIGGQHLKNYLTNLQVLITELYKAHHGLAPELMNDIFKKEI